MRRILIYFDFHFTFIRTSKDFHLFLFFLDGNYRVFLTRVKYPKIPYNRNPVKLLLTGFKLWYFARILHVLKTRDNFHLKKLNKNEKLPKLIII